jgi:hypothetical protein
LRNEVKQAIWNPASTRAEGAKTDFVVQVLPVPTSAQVEAGFQLAPALRSGLAGMTGVERQTRRADD